MSDLPATSDPPWPAVLSQISHEIRTPLSVSLGWMRMVLSERMGPLTEKQQHALGEIDKAIYKIKALTDQLSELAKFDAEDAKDRTRFECAPLHIGPVVEEAITALPPVEDGRDLRVVLENRAPDATIKGDRARLLRAMTSIFYATRRELVGTDRLVVRLRGASSSGRPALRVSIAGDHRIEEVEGLPEEQLARFNEKRGGCGLGPTLARRILAEHRARIWSTPGAAERNAEAVVVFPER